MNTNNQVVVTASPSSNIVTANEMLFDTSKFAALDKFARIMASGAATVPKHLSGNIGDCMAIAMQAMQWGMNPFAVAQKTHIVNGTLGYEAQLVNAVINSMAPTTGRLQFEWHGNWDDLLKDTKNKSLEAGCYVRVWATIKGEDSPRELSVYMSQATVRNSPLWVSDPKQQLAYLGIKKWARLYTPDVIMGVYTKDEMEDLTVNPSQYAPVQSEVIEEAEIELPAYAQERFDKMFPKYSKAIEEGRATAAEVIADIEGRAIMTDDQKLTYTSFEQEIKEADKANSQEQSS